MAADKTKTIKGATDKELDELIVRLRKEQEVQSLVSDIKRKSGSGYIPYDHGQEISTEKPIETLYHIGVLGMKWGRKTGARKISVSKTQTKEDDSDDHKKKLVLKKKKLNTMSNTELKSLNERFQLEKQYKELTKVEMSPGRKFVTELLVNTAKDVATTYVKKYANKGVEDLLKKVTK